MSAILIPVRVVGNEAFAEATMKLYQSDKHSPVIQLIVGLNWAKGNITAIFWNESAKYGKKLDIIGPYSVIVSNNLVSVPDEVLTRNGYMKVRFKLEQESDPQVSVYTNAISLPIIETIPLSVV